MFMASSACFSFVGIQICTMHRHSRGYFPPVQMHAEVDGERVVPEPLHRGPPERVRQVAVAVQRLNLTTRKRGGRVIQIPAVRCSAEEAGLNNRQGWEMKSDRTRNEINLTFSYTFRRESCGMIYCFLFAFCCGGCSSSSFDDG